MTAFRTLPDLEAVASVALRSADIEGLNGVYSSVPARNPRYPLITVDRAGGSPAVREILDRAYIRVLVWGGLAGDGPGAPSKSQILDIAQEARVVLLEMEGQTVHDPVDAFITAVEDGSGLSWKPDQTGRDRYIFTMWMYGFSLDPLEI